ncbi:DUF2975 domain-containing protein [Algoriphagus sp.]|uniref:DUF2975 domain-containing protein n=1 Tax=Algoriphagus sp. TaxID=1872435 RepID=UPI003295046D
MSKSEKFVFIALHIIAWIIFVGLCIEAGGLLVNFAFSIFKPEMVPNLYQKLDLSAMFVRSEWAFYSMYSLVLTIALLKAILFYIVIMLLLKLDLSNPFNDVVSEKISRISYITFSIGIISYIARQFANNLMHKGYATADLNQFWGASEAFILMAAIIYIISVIFKKGLAIQAENDLTV